MARTVVNFTVEALTHDHFLVTIAPASLAYFNTFTDWTWRVRVFITTFFDTTQVPVDLGGGQFLFDTNQYRFPMPYAELRDDAPSSLRMFVYFDLLEPSGATTILNKTVATKTRFRPGMDADTHGKFEIYVGEEMRPRTSPSGYMVSLRHFGASSLYLDNYDHPSVQIGRDGYAYMAARRRQIGELPIPKALRRGFKSNSVWEFLGNMWDLACIWHSMVLLPYGGAAAVASRFIDANTIGLYFKATTDPTLSHWPDDADEKPVITVVKANFDLYSTFKLLMDNKGFYYLWTPRNGLAAGVNNTPRQSLISRNGGSNWEVFLP